jgi:hypothetical protein
MWCRSVDEAVSEYGCDVAWCEAAEAYQRDMWCTGVCHTWWMSCEETSDGVVGEGLREDGGREMMGEEAT